MQTYAFTSKPIANALIHAKNNGIDIHILSDKSQTTQKYSQVPRLVTKGINVQIDHTTGLAHNKIMIIDDHTVFTGSYDFTNAANTRNAENLLRINSKKMTQIYQQEWNHRYQNAEKITNRKK